MIQKHVCTTIFLAALLEIAKTRNKINIVIQKIEVIITNIKKSEENTLSTSVNANIN